MPVVSDSGRACRPSRAPESPSSTHGSPSGIARHVGDEAITFVDLEEINDLFNGSLPNRVRLEGIPVSGRWFEPSSSLDALLANTGR